MYLLVQKCTSSNFFPPFLCLFSSFTADKMSLVFVCVHTRSCTHIFEFASWPNLSLSLDNPNFPVSPFFLWACLDSRSTQRTGLLHTNTWIPHTCMHHTLSWSMKLFKTTPLRITPNIKVKGVKNEDIERVRKQEKRNMFQGSSRYLLLGRRTSSSSSLHASTSHTALLTHTLPAGPQPAKHLEQS